ncbi:MAG: hypothetical protein OXU36_02340 [Candidatus Poribacteria bacterium]|nr:hypothetical protein [Candidatus Poribacteria bacterium]
MDAVIVDTNVIVIANDTDDDDRRDCRDLCQDRLQQIWDQRETVILDNGWRILGEYEDNTNPNSRKGIGDLFVKRLLQNLGNPNICTMMPITPSVRNGADFEEFPSDDALSGFDPDDRKFIAVAVAYENVHQQKAILLQAVDSQWYGFREALVENGLEIEFVCETYIRDLYERRNAS